MDHRRTVPSLLSLLASALLLASAPTLVACGDSGDGPQDAAVPAETSPADAGGDALAAPGTPCTGAQQCTSGSCVDGVCCDSACAGACEACNVSGQEGVCTTLSGPQPECGGDAACGLGVCAAGACTYPAQGADCGSACDAAKNQMVTRTCDATHQCIAAPPASCGPYTCKGDGSACRDGCLDHTQCTADSACDRTRAHTTGTGTCLAPGSFTWVGSDAAALEAAVDAAADGDVLVVPPGSYDGGFGVKGKTLTIIGRASGSSEVTVTYKAHLAKVPALGSVLHVSYASDVTLQNLVLTGATDGAGLSCIALSNSALSVIESRIEGNTRWGIDSLYCGLTVRRSVVTGNAWGGIRLKDHAAQSPPSALVNNLVLKNGGQQTTTGGIWIENIPADKLTVEHNTVAGNAAASAGCNNKCVGGIRCVGSAPELKRTIVWGNTVLAGTTALAGGCSFSDSDVEGQSASGSNISQAPLFAGGSGPQAYTLGSGSPCIDAGGAAAPASPIDFAGAPRKQASAVDIGALETPAP